MTVSLVYLDGHLGPKFKKAMDGNLSIIARASTGGARAAAKEIKERGDRDISFAGRFGKRWLDSLHADVRPKSGALVNAVINVFHTIPYAHVFEFGATIKAKNPTGLLWIPLSFAHIPKGMWARDWGRKFGGLFRVNRKHGKSPLLLSIRDKEPKYFGIPQVRIRKRFHLREISRDVMTRFAEFYTANLKE